jgi:hypothetical protein
MAQGEHFAASQRKRLRRAGLAHEPQMRRGIVNHPVAVNQPPKQQTQALQASVHRSRWVPLFMNQMCPKGR